MKISPVNNTFKGIYVSNALAPGRQRNYAKEIKEDFIKNGLDYKYEKLGMDILINPGFGSVDGINLEFVPYSIKRVLDDDYSRWSGRFN